MADEYIVEICDSKYDHHKMVELDKSYYQRYDGKIICDECIQAWIADQSSTIASALQPRIETLINTINEAIYPDQVNIEYKIPITVESYMNNIFNKINATVQFYHIPERTTYDEETNENTVTAEEYNNFCVYFEFFYLSTATEPSYVNNLQIDPISNYDTEDETVLFNYLKERAEAVLSTCVTGDFQIMEETKVLQIIEALGAMYSSVGYGDSTSSDECLCGTVEDAIAVCAKCGVGLIKPYYIYYNAPYCVDDTYRYVVDAAIKMNLSEQVGLATAGDVVPETYRTYGSTREFRISVIDKYIKCLGEFAQIYKVI